MEKIRDEIKAQIILSIIWGAKHYKEKGNISAKEFAMDMIPEQNKRIDQIRQAFARWLRSHGTVDCNGQMILVNLTPEEINELEQPCEKKD